MGVIGILKRALPPACAAGVFALLGRTAAAVALACIALALVLMSVVAPGVAVRLDRLVERAATAAASAISYLLSILAFVLGVVPAWAFGRTTRRTSLGNPWLSRRSAWTTPPSHGGRSGARLGEPARAGAPDSLPAVPSTARRCGGAAIVVVVVLAGVWVVRERSTPELPIQAAPADVPGAARALPDLEPRRAQVLDAEEFDGLVVDDYAHEDEPWAAAALGEVKQLPYSPDLMLGHRLGDFEGRYVNTVDGRRVSYTPDDPELTVWFFGGSTMLGIGQRDDHTLPSVVARLAERDGIRIRAVNFGVSGYVNWQSLEQFQQALTSDLERPDLVVFYEGVNDSGLGSARVDIGARDRDSITRLWSTPDELEHMREQYPGVPAMPWSVQREELEIELSAKQYARGSELADRLADRHGIEVVRFWQPSPFAKRLNDVDAPLWERTEFDPGWMEQSTLRYRGIARRSGVEPIDLTRVLDDVEVPVYFDSSHTNELGAGLVGAALYDALRADLRAASEATR